MEPQLTVFQVQITALLIMTRHHQIKPNQLEMSLDRQMELQLMEPQLKDFPVQIAVLLIMTRHHQIKPNQLEMSLDRQMELQ